MGQCDLVPINTQFTRIFAPLLTYDHLVDVAKAATPVDSEYSLHPAEICPRLPDSHQPLFQALAKSKCLFVDASFDFASLGAEQRVRICHLKDALVAEQVDSKKVQMTEMNLRYYYFGCLVRGVAWKYPQLLQDMMLTKQNAYGIHLVKTFLLGHPTVVVVDDFIPFVKGKTMFLSPCEQSYWPPLLEKVWAKLHTSYEKAFKSSPLSILCDLFGISAKMYQYQKHQKEMGKWVQEGKLVYLLVTDETKGVQSVGKLVPKQLFLLRGVKELEMYEGKTVLCLEGPMTNELAGRVNRSLEWKTLRREFKLDDFIEDHYNFLTREQAREVFKSAIVGSRLPCVCFHLHEGLERKYYRLKVPAECEVHLRVVQCDSEFVKVVSGTYGYENLYADFLRIGDRGSVLVPLTEPDSLVHSKESHLYRGVLKPGEYLLRLEARWKNFNSLASATIVVESSTPVEFEERVGKKEGFRDLADAYTACMVKDSVLQKVNSSKEVKSKCVGRKVLVLIRQKCKGKTQSRVRFSGCNNLLYVSEHESRPLEGDLEVKVEHVDESEALIILEQLELAQSSELKDFEIQLDDCTS